MITEEEVLSRPVNPATKWLLSLSEQRKRLAAAGLKESAPNAYGWTTMERIKEEFPSGIAEDDEFTGDRYENARFHSEEGMAITVIEAEKFTKDRNSRLSSDAKNQAVTVEDVLRVWRSW